MGKKFLLPVNLLLIIGIFFGVAFAILTPFGTGFDEGAHLARIYDISGFNFLPNRGIYDTTVSFSEFYTLSYRRLFFRDEGMALFKPEMFLARADYSNMAIEETMSIYPPLMFLPHALVAGIGWRALDLPIIPVTIVMRLVGLAIYLLGCALALRLLPVGKWATLALMLSPTAIYQAATVNGDGYSNAVSFLFIGLVLSYALRAEHQFTRRELSALVVVILLVGFAKPGAILLLPLLFVLARGHFSSRSQAVVMWGSAVVAAVFHILWLFIGVANTQAGESGLGNTLTTILAQMGDYVAVMAASMAQSLGAFYRAMIAGYGYWVGNPPGVVFWLVPLVYLLALLMEEKRDRVSRAMRAYLLALMLACWLGILVLYTGGKFTGGSSGTVEITQGRYLIPFTPLLFIAVAGLLSVTEKWRALLRKVIPAGIIIYLGFFFWGLIAHFYTPCGVSLLARENCKLPAYQNLDAVTPPSVELDKDTRLEQSFISICRDVRSVEVLLDDQPGRASGALRYSLYTKAGELVTSAEVDAAAIVPLQTLALSVPEGVRLGEGEYRIVLQGLSLTSGVGVAVRTPDRYPGPFILNGEAFDGDLVFYYYCAPVGLFGY